MEHLNKILIKMFQVPQLIKNKDRMGKISVQIEGTILASADTIGSVAELLNEIFKERGMIY
jgi:hypothetical protein